MTCWKSCLFIWESCTDVNDASFGRKLICREKTSSRVRSKLITEKRTQFRKGLSCSRPCINPLPGCIEALNRISIDITKPRLTDCSNPAQYFHREGCVPLPVQAICKSRYRFTFFSAKCSGPTHDSVAFSISNYARRLNAGDLPSGYWSVVDDAYVCGENVIMSLSNFLPTN